MPEPMGDFSYTWPFYAGALLGYLLGSIPFGLILTRLAGLGDIRQIGSGNIGATNVLRTGNKALAALTLVLDGGKGAAAVLIGNHFGPDMAVIAGAAALLGHVFPVWLRFKGGKGVATALGVLLGIAFPAGALACATWLALAAAPVYVWWLGDVQRAELALFIAVLVWLRHAANIRRLIRGEEPKIGRKNQ
jgi:glycerol-3-phosphate acyltransferase PlsY